MNSIGTRGATLVLGILASFVMTASPADAGPELLCWPFDIGGAQSLPMGTTGWRAVDQSYDIKRLADDTLGLLTPDTPALVRMETLRRAVVYSKDDSAASDDLLSRLQGRVHVAEKTGKGEALAWFDLGYFVEARRQASILFKVLAPLKGLDGYALVTKALGQRGEDPQMEYAAALLARVRGLGAEWPPLLRRALEGAKTDQLLARNVVKHQEILPVPADIIVALRSQHDLSKD